MIISVTGPKSAGTASTSYLMWGSDMAGLILFAKHNDMNWAATFRNNCQLSTCLSRGKKRKMNDESRCSLFLPVTQDVETPLRSYPKPCVLSSMHVRSIFMKRIKETLGCSPFSHGMLNRRNVKTPFRSCSSSDLSVLTRLCLSMPNVMFVCSTFATLHRLSSPSPAAPCSELYPTFSTSPTFICPVSLLAAPHRR